MSWLLYVNEQRGYQTACWGETSILGGPLVFLAVICKALARMGIHAGKLKCQKFVLGANIFEKERSGGNKISGMF